MNRVILLSLSLLLLGGLVYGQQSSIVYSPDNKFQLTLYDGMQQRKDLNKKAQIQGGNPEKELYVIVITAPKTNFAADYSTNQLFYTLTVELVNSLDSAKVISTYKKTQINGFSALQSVINGTFRENLGITYLMTAVETENHYHQILAWTLQSMYKDNEATLRKVVNSFSLAKPVVSQEPTKASFALESNLPDRTLAYLGFPNITKARDAFRLTALHKIYQEPEVQKLIQVLLTPFQSEIDKGFQQVQQNLGMSVPELLQLFSGEVAIGVIDVDPENQMMPVSPAISLQFSNREKVEQLITLGQQMSGSEFAKASYSWAEGRTSHEIPVYMGPICYAVFDNTLLVAANWDLLKEILDNYTQQKAASLSSTANFQMAKGKVQGRGVPVALLYLNFAGLFQQFSPMVPPPVLEHLSKLGVFNLQFLAVGSGFYQEYAHKTVYVHIKDARNTIFSTFDLGAISPEILESVPSHSIGFSAVHIDYPKCIKKLEDIIQQVSPLVSPQEDMFAMYQQMSGQLDKMLGFSLKGELLASLGANNYSFSYMPKEGGLIPRTVYVSALRDEKLFLQCIHKLSDLLQVELKETSQSGTKFYYYTNRIGELGRSNPLEELDPGRSRNRMEFLANSVGVSISGMAFLIEDGYVYSTAGGQDMRSFLAERGGWQQSILENPAFAKVQSAMAKDSSLVVYLDSRSLVNAWWNTLMPVIRSMEGYIRGFGVPLETALLPEAITISRHLSPGIMSYAFNDDGIYLSVHTTLGQALPPIVITAGVLAGLLTIRDSGEIEIKERSISAEEQIRQFMDALDLYKLYTGSYPPTSEGLEALTKGMGTNNPIMRSIPKDPWGNDYEYKRIGGQYKITSYGADGEPGGEGHDADITSSSKK